ncbi:MAG TPA: recombinase XerC, partial [Gordonia polyisoprenivorans]|nr:recombinase XerC [Gordonia polyisoprenivorans]
MVAGSAVERCAHRMTDADRADRPGSVDGVGADVGRGSTVLADFAEYLRFEKG